jgi:hypothetical protein
MPQALSKLKYLSSYAAIFLPGDDTSYSGYEEF